MRIIQKKTRRGVTAHLKFSKLEREAFAKRFPTRRAAIREIARIEREVKAEHPGLISMKPSFQRVKA